MKTMLYERRYVERNVALEENLILYDRGSERKEVDKRRLKNCVNVLNVRN